MSDDEDISMADGDELLGNSYAKKPTTTLNLITLTLGLGGQVFSQARGPTRVR